MSVRDAAELLRNRMIRPMIRPTIRRMHHAEIRQLPRLARSLLCFEARRATQATLWIAVTWCGVAALGFSDPSFAQTPPASIPATSPTTPGLPPPAPAGQAIPGPMKADPPGVDFGVVEPGTTVSATIKLVNPLDRPVTIKMAKPSCTCTTVDMVGKVIPAMGTIDMPMSMKTAHSVGKRSAQINLVFEGINQVLGVRIDAETAYAVRANPPFIDALAAERMKGFFELISTDGVPFTVRAVDGKPPESPDGKPMAPAPRHIVRYDFTRDPTAKVPPFLIVETDHPKCPLLDLRVRHESTRITPALGFAEYRANLGVLAPKGNGEFELEIKHMGAARVSRVSSLNAAAKTELLEQKSDGDSLLVKVRFEDLGLPKGMFLFPCRFESGVKTADFLLYGVIR